MRFIPYRAAVGIAADNTGNREYDVLQKSLADLLSTDLWGVEQLQIVEPAVNFAGSALGAAAGWATLENVEGPREARGGPS